MTLSCARFNPISRPKNSILGRKLVDTDFTKSCGQACTIFRAFFCFCRYKNRETFPRGTERRTSDEEEERAGERSSIFADQHARRNPISRAALASAHRLPPTHYSISNRKKQRHHLLLPPSPKCEALHKSPTKLNDNPPAT